MCTVDSAHDSKQYEIETEIEAPASEALKKETKQ